MRSLKLHAPQPPPELPAAEAATAAELSPARMHAARGAAVANGPARLETTHPSQQAAAAAAAAATHTDGGSDDNGGSRDQPPQMASQASFSPAPAEPTHEEALDKMHVDVRRDSRDGHAFGTCSSAVQIGRSRPSTGDSPSQPASLESVSSSFSLSSSSSSPSSSSSSALSSSSSSSTNIPATNGPNSDTAANHKQPAPDGSGSSNSSNGGPASNGGSSSGNSSSSSGHGGSHSSSSNSNMTAFLSKLWRMVNDSHNDDQIRWSQSGCSFVIINQIQFAKDMLPIYFKHSNMASFIRQLNMYGFRKIPLMGANKSGDQRADLAQFYHVNFMRGQEQRLSSIKRKNNSSRTQNLVVNGSFCDEVRAILRDVKSIRDGQNSSESILGALQLDNKSLWRDVAILRSQHHKQRRVIEKLIQFLVSLIQNRNQLVRKRRMKFMISPENLAAAIDGNASSSGGGGGNNPETGDILFNLTANQADEGLFQMGELVSHSEQVMAADHNHNHHHHHHHPYYSQIHHAPTTSEANSEHELRMEVDSIDEHQGGNATSRPTTATFANDDNGKREPGEIVHVLHRHQQQPGRAESSAPGGIRRASSSSMASVSGAGTNRHYQLFELGAATAAASPAESSNVASSSPSVLMYERDGSSSSMGTRNATTNSRRVDANSVVDNDELVPNGATAASMSASGAQQYLATSGRSSSSTPKSHNNHGGSNGAHSRQASMSQRLSQLGQENIIKVKGSSSPSVAIQQQHHHQHQLQQPDQRQQQQMQHLQQLAGAQQSDLQPTTGDGMNTHGSQLLSSGGGSVRYSNVPMLVRANGGASLSEQRQHNNMFGGNQQLNMVTNGHLQQQIHSGHHILQQQHQHQQHHQRQQPQLTHYGGGGGRPGASQNGPDHRHQQQQQHSINGLLAGRRHHYGENLHQQHQQLQARPTGCHPQLSQWTANSIYNTMAQPDLVSMASGGGGGGDSLANGFSNMGGVFNELRVRPSFLSALGQRQQAGTSSSAAPPNAASGSNANEIGNSEAGAGHPSPGGHNILGSLSADNNSQINGRLSTASSNNSQTYY